jgi:hypothetical protein
VSAALCYSPTGSVPTTFSAKVISTEAGQQLLAEHAARLKATAKR